MKNYKKTEGIKLNLFTLFVAVLTFVYPHFLGKIYNFFFWGGPKEVTDTFLEQQGTASPTDNVSHDILSFQQSIINGTKITFLNPVSSIVIFTALVNLIAQPIILALFKTKHYKKICRISYLININLVIFFAIFAVINWIINNK